MTPESSNNLDLIKSRLSAVSFDPVEKAAKGLAADKTQGKEADKKRWKAALGFEGMFLSQMYKGMRQTTIGDDDELTKASPGREIFTEMLDNTYATMSAKNPVVSGDKGMQDAVNGVSNSMAAQIYRSLSRQEGAPPSSTAVPGMKKTDGSDRRVRPSPPFLAKLLSDAKAGEPAAASFLSDARLKPIVELAAKTYGVSANLIQSVIKAESNNQPLAVSGAGAKGLMQLMDSTARDMGVRNVFNANDNILGGTKYLKQMLDRFGGDETKALAAYNAGPTVVERFNGVPPYLETKAYVEKILNAKKNLDAASNSYVTDEGD